MEEEAQREEERKEEEAVLNGKEEEAERSGGAAGRCCSAPRRHDCHPNWEVVQSAMVVGWSRQKDLRRGAEEDRERGEAPGSP